MPKRLGTRSVAIISAALAIITGTDHQSLLSLLPVADAFIIPSHSPQQRRPATTEADACRRRRCNNNINMARTINGGRLNMAQISQGEAQKAIDTVVAALRKDAAANKDLGRLDKVTVILGYGSPTNDVVAVRFNAQFRKNGMGRSAIPLPFGLGQTNQSEGRGTMVGQVKASVDTKTKKVQNCSVFRDLGYGRSFELKC